MAVAVTHGQLAEQVAPSVSVNLTTLTVAAGANMCVVGMLYLGTGTSGYAVSWNSDGTPEPMSYVIGTLTDDPFSGLFFFCYKLNPTPGTHTMSATWSGTSSALLAGVSFSGVSAVADGMASEALSADPPIALVTTSLGGATIAHFGSFNRDALTTVTGQEIYIYNPSYASSALSVILGGGVTNSHEWTMSGTSFYAVAGFHLLPSAPTVDLMGQVLT